MAQEVQHHIFDRFLRGWDPHQLPPSYMDPRDVDERQVMDARGVRFTRGGSIEWQRDQFRVSSPTGADIDDVKAVLEFNTADYEQLLAFMRPTLGTFGTTTQGASESEIDDRISGSVFSCTESASLKQISAYLRPVITGGTPTVKAAIYQDSDLTLVAESKPVEVATEGWTDFEFEWPTLLPVDYVLVVWAEDLAGSSVYLAYDAGAVGDGPYDDETFGPWPGSLASTAEARDYSIHADYLPYYGELHYMDVDWSAETPVQWTYGYELFEHETWTEVTGSPYVPWWGPSDAVQAGETLLIAFAGSGRPLLRWNGASLATVGIDAPTSAPTVAEDTGDTTDYAAGTYTYFYTYTDGEFESMPSEVPSGVTPPSTWKSKEPVAASGVSVAISDGNGVNVSGLADHASESYDKKLYRAYTASTDSGAQGDQFFYIATIDHGTTTYDDNEVPVYAQGDITAFDHALPPRATMLCWHKDRAWLAGATEGSRSYDDYSEGYWENVLFFSELDEPYYYPGDNYVVVGDDTPITGLVSWGDVLMVFKANSVWAVRGWSSADFRVDLITSGVGCQSDAGAAAGPDGVLWQAADGYYFYNGAKIRRVLDIPADSPWGLVNPGSTVPTLAYHDSRFYVAQEDGWLEWEPGRDVWCYHAADLEDTDGYPAGFRPFASGPYQAHVLTVMEWADGQGREITVLDAGTAFSNGDSAGSSYSDLRAPVRVTLGPLEAPPGYLIRPLEVWADCEYTDDADSSKRPKLYLNTDGGYSDTAGDNAWATTPDAPTAGEVIGVPASYVYSGTSYRTNMGRRWYVQIDGESAADFVLHALRVSYVLVRDRGGT